LNKREKRLENEKKKRIVHLCLYEENSMKIKTKKIKYAKEKEASKEVKQKEMVNEKKVAKKTNWKKETEKREDGKWGGAGCCMRRRLAICVLFYDDYKYGRKALCLEQLVRLSKFYPYSPPSPHSRRLFRL